MNCDKSWFMAHLTQFTPDGQFSLHRPRIVCERFACRKPHMLRFIAFLIGLVVMTHAAAAQPVQLYSAGSLKGAWLETIQAFEAATGIKVQPRFGPSGVLKDDIVAGAKADVFTSANMEHPQALAAARLSGPVVLFARNRLCAIARPGLDVEPATLLDRMLDPTVKLATSTPKADPAGDYAWM